MREDVPLPGPGFKIDWATLNNALFSLICADPELRARYDTADSAQAKAICSDQFDRLAADASLFVQRFIVLER